MQNIRIMDESRRRFDELFRRSRRRAYNLAYRMTGNAADAEDVTQDAYVRAWRHFDKFHGDASFETWLFRILANQAIDLQRRKNRRPLCSLDAPAQGESGRLLESLLTAPDGDPEQIVLEPIGEERLSQAMFALPESHRKILLMRAVEERSYQEIADALRCPLGTVRSRIHRGRTLIRRSLEADGALGEFKGVDRSLRAA